MQQPTTPSRNFLVQQATLTAMAAAYPFSSQIDGRSYVGHRLFGLVRDEFQEGAEFCARVRAEYRALAARHGVAA